MFRLIALVTVVFIISQTGLALKCYECENDCREPEVKECFSNVSPTFKDLIKSYKVACASLEIYTTSGKMIVSKKCTIDNYSNRTNFCEHAIERASFRYLNKVHNMTCEICYTNICNPLPERTDKLP